jgi:hypothetical protein
MVSASTASTIDARNAAVTADPRCTLIITVSLHHAALNEQAFSLLSARRQEHQKIETQADQEKSKGRLRERSAPTAITRPLHFRGLDDKSSADQIGGGIALVGTRGATATELLLVVALAIRVPARAAHPIARGTDSFSTEQRDFRLDAALNERGYCRIRRITQ